MLGGLGAGSGRHKHGAGRDIEGVGAVAPGADNVHQVGGVRYPHLGGELAHHLCGSGDFANGFFLDAQAGDDGRGHDGRELAAHDQPHQVQHLVVKNFAVFNGALQRLLRGDGHGGHRAEITCVLGR